MKLSLRLFFVLVLIALFSIPIGSAFAETSSSQNNNVSSAKSVADLLAMIDHLQSQLDYIRQKNTSSVDSYPIIITAPSNGKQLKVGDSILIKWKVDREISKDDIPKKIYILGNSGTDINGNSTVRFDSIYLKPISVSRKSYKFPSWGYYARVPGKYQIKFVEANNTPSDDSNWNDNEVVSQTVTFFVK